MRYSYSGAGALRYSVQLREPSFELADEIRLCAQRRVLMMQLDVRALQPVDSVHHLPFHRDEPLLGCDCATLGRTDRVTQLVDHVARAGTLRRAQALNLAL